VNRHFSGRGEFFITPTASNGRRMVVTRLVDEGENCLPFFFITIRSPRVCFVATNRFTLVVRH
jgi:hypothetical protein